MAVINKYHYAGRIPPDAVNIMRGTPFGNPFPMGEGIEGSREYVVERYRRWLWDRIKAESAFAEQVKALHGKDLCCCCAPKLCHGHVLERAAAWLVFNQRQDVATEQDCKIEVEE